MDLCVSDKKEDGYSRREVRGGGHELSGRLGSSGQEYEAAKELPWDRSTGWQHRSRLPCRSRGHGSLFTAVAGGTRSLGCPLPSQENTYSLNINRKTLYIMQASGWAQWLGHARRGNTPTHPKHAKNLKHLGRGNQSPGSRRWAANAAQPWSLDMHNAPVLNYHGHGDAMCPARQACCPAPQPLWKRQLLSLNATMMHLRSARPRATGPSSWRSWTRTAPS